MLSCLMVRLKTDFRVCPRDRDTDRLLRLLVEVTSKPSGFKTLVSHLTELSVLVWNEGTYVTMHV